MVLVTFVSAVFEFRSPPFADSWDFGAIIDPVTRQGFNTDRGDLSNQLSLNDLRRDSQPGLSWT